MKKEFHLSAKQKELIALFADHSMPKGGPYELGARDLPMGDRVEALAAICADEVKLSLKITLFLLEWMSWYLCGKFLVMGLVFVFYFPAFSGRFTRMNYDQREKLLRHWRDHPVYLLRSLFLSLNSLCQMVYFSDARVLEAISYDGHKQGVNAFTPGTPAPSKELLASQGLGVRP
ncbi:MAG: hypothetical protein AB1405_07275 [Bdellovibrionota bacterium]